MKMLNIRIKPKLNPSTHLNDKFAFPHKTLWPGILRIGNPNSEPFKHELATCSQFEYSALN